MSECKIIKFPLCKAEEIEDHNCEAILHGVNEHKDLYAIRSLLVTIDKRNGIEGDEPVLNHGLKIVDNAIERNEMQVHHDRQEQEILDDIARKIKITRVRKEVLRIA